jgi:ACS family hexuronate transporter-like MFS transporter
MVCALLFVASTINYTDRQVLGFLAPMLQVKIGWTEAQYAYIGTSFLIAYALGLLFMGPLIDRVGTRIGYAIAIAIWGLAALSHSLVRSALGFGIARFALGFGESGNFPAAVKTIAEWFPQKERALATSIFNSGTNVGATIVPLVVPWIALRFGWQYAFLLTGAFSAIWIVCWLTFYCQPQDDKRISTGELGHIMSDPPDPPARIAWLHLLTYRQTWTVVMGKFLTDPIWWFFLFGGWLAGRLILAGWTVNRARKTAMLVCAMVVVPVILAARMHSLWGAIALISLAVAAHQGWSANLLTLASDMFPRNAVASVVSLGTFGGAIGGALIATLTGFLLQVTHSYVPIFLIAGLAYLTALLVIQFLSPRLQPVLTV